MTRRVFPILLLLGTAWLAGVPAARAEERPVRVPLFLDLLNVPIESPEVAFRESLRRAPAPAPEPEWVILPDGSARYGSGAVSVIVKNPCPDGTHLPLPGRRPR